ncbi:MAG: 4Fe-4S dicluster domain-containing protein [Selenomonadaceae bacterium]|nr:4Fe-4S dicluster domain-containing protein [Selenomonadaceae bacterium]
MIPCTTCNYCAKACPQHIFIREELEKVSEALGQMNRAHFLSIVLNLGASMIQH